MRSVYRLLLISLVLIGIHLKERYQIVAPLHKIIETSYNTGVTPPPGLEIC